MTGMQCPGGDAPAEAPVSADPPLHVMVGAEVQPDTGLESEDEKLPPYSASDDPADGLHCYVAGCGSSYFSWKSLMKHLRNAHKKQQPSFKGTALREMAMREQREDDRARHHKKLGKPCPPKKDVAHSLKADTVSASAPAPPPTKIQPSEPSAASSEHVSSFFVWHPPEQ